MARLACQCPASSVCFAVEGRPDDGTVCAEFALGGPGVTQRGAGGLFARGAAFSATRGTTLSATYVAGKACETERERESVREGTRPRIALSREPSRLQTERCVHEGTIHKQSGRLSLTRNAPRRERERETRGRPSRSFPLSLDSFSSSSRRETDRCLSQRSPPRQRRRPLFGRSRSSLSLSLSLSSGERAKLSARRECRASPRVRASAEKLEPTRGFASRGFFLRKRAAGGGGGGRPIGLSRPFPALSHKTRRKHTPHATRVATSERSGLCFLRDAAVSRPGEVLRVARLRTRLSPRVEIA